jgi:GAF domain-containing protein/HAMP domain-containing protein
LTCVGYILIFFETQAWQVLGPAGLLAAASVLFLVARSLARQGYSDRAAYLMVGVMLMLPTFALFWTGAPLVLAFGTLILSIALASLVLPSRQVVWAALAGLVAAGLTFLIDQVAPWPRFDMAQLNLFRAFVLGTIGLAVLAILWQIARAYRYTDTIRTRLLIAFVSIVLLMAVVVSTAVAVLGFESAQRQATGQLETVATLKQAEIRKWVRNSQVALGYVLTTEDTQRYLHLLLHEDAHDPLRWEAHLGLQERLQHAINQGRHFSELALLNPQGEVVVSTDPTEEGENYSRQLYFQEGLKGAYIQPPSSSPSLPRLSIVFSRPVIDREGRTFVLVGHTSVGVLEGIMVGRTSLGETMEIYLVNSEYDPVTPTALAGEGMYVRSQGVNAVLASQGNGSALYENYWGRPVVGVYHWLPELQVALMAEQEQAEALRSTYVTLSIIGGVALAAILAAVAVSLLITRSIANPLANLAQTVTQIADGDLERTAAIEREDEIGALAQAFNSMTSQLRGIIKELEQRVADRTGHLERRAVQLQAAAEVGRAAASIRDLDKLLSQVTYLISERFGFYHVGIFLLDNAGEYAVLQAANSEGGQQMLARGHRLKVGAQGIVGYVASAREPRIVLDVGEDSIHFKNPYLPQTRSEMALPLVVGDQVLGALDVQSTQEAAFAQEDIEVLQVLTDQVAIAIENARLFAGTQEALEATRRAYGDMTRQAWEEMLRARPELGFRSDERGVTSAREVWRPEMERALNEGQTIQEKGNGSDAVLPLAIPIKVRGQVVGVLDTCKPDKSNRWTAQEITTLEQIAEQLGAALESARLYENVQRSAARERLTREITDQMRRATSVDGIVQTAVDSLFNVLGTSRAFARLEAAPPAADHEKDGQKL